jgi:polyisoprenoid-binding protein YceI
MGLYFVKGRFHAVDGWIEVGVDGAPRRGELKIDARSISTRIPPRDWHLRTHDFLDVARHPTINVVVDAVQQGQGEFGASAMFTIRGTSAPVQLHGHLHGEHEPTVVHLHGTLDRHAVGVRARRPFEWIVGREVQSTRSSSLPTLVIPAERQPSVDAPGPSLGGASDLAEAVGCGLAARVSGTAFQLLKSGSERPCGRLTAGMLTAALQCCRATLALRAAADPEAPAGLRDSSHAPGRCASTGCRRATAELCTKLHLSESAGSHDGKDGDGERAVRRTGSWRRDVRSAAGAPGGTARPHGLCRARAAGRHVPEPRLHPDEDDDRLGEGGASGAPGRRFRRSRG